MEMKITILKHVLAGTTNPFAMSENVDSYIDYVKTVITMVEEREEESMGFEPLVLDCIKMTLETIVEMAKVKCPTIRKYWDKLDKMASILDIVTDDLKTVEQQKEAVRIAQMLLIVD